MTYDTQGRRVLQGHPSTWPQEVEQLKAENERLRAALTYIRDGKKLNHFYMRRIAETALQEGQQCTQTT